MKKAISLFLALLFVAEPLMAGIPGDKSVYVGGTVASIQQGGMGVLDYKDDTTLKYAWNKGGQSGTWSVPYKNVTSLSYGQHAGRRVGATVAWGVTTLGIMALPLLFSKKRRHYLTVEYTDENGKPQAAVFEVGKNAIRTTLASLEVRTGQKVAYEDEEAKKAGSK
jgi:hypothetical protein